MRHTFLMFRINTNNWHGQRITNYTNKIFSYETIIYVNDESMKNKSSITATFKSNCGKSSIKILFQKKEEWLNVYKSV